MADEIEVEAEVIDSPQVLSGADKWLADVSSRVAARVDNYNPHEITSAEDYKQSKRDRTALRKDIAEIDAERKSQTRAVKDAVRRFELGCKDVLTPLTDMEAQYKSSIDAYEQGMIDTRRIRLAQEYAEMAPDLVPLVPFETLCGHYAEEGKWFNISTGERKASELMQKAVDKIAADEQTISATTQSPEEEQEVKTEYFQTLDLSSALRNCIARREQRQRVAELERRRREREEYERSVESAPVSEPDTSSDEFDVEPEQVPEVEEREPQESSERLFVYEVTVPESKSREFRDAMVRLGWAHGRKVGVRYAE